MTGQDVAYIVIGFLTATGALLGGIAAYRKFRPENDKVGVETLDVNIRIAGKVRDDAYAAYEREREEKERERAEKKDLENRVALLEERIEEVMADLNEERRLRRADLARQEEEATRKLEEERRARRLAENREAEHAAEVRRLWRIVTGLRDILRASGIDVPEDLMTGGIGELPEDNAPHNSWSEHSKDQERE